METNPLSSEELVRIFELSVVLTSHDHILYMSPIARDVLNLDVDQDLSQQLFSEFFVDDDPRHPAYPVIELKQHSWSTAVKLVGSHIKEHNHVFLKGMMLDFEKDLALYTVDFAGFDPKRRQIDIMSNIVDHTPISIVITDLRGTILYVNEKFVELTGYSKEEAIGQKPSILKSGYHNRDTYIDLWKTLREEKIWKGVFYNRKKDGRFFWESGSIQPVVGYSGRVEYYVAIKEDITDRKLLEDQLNEKNESLEYALKLLQDTQAQMIQQEKMASVGQLAAGVAHEINNPLGFITSNISTLSGYSTKLKDYMGNLEELVLLKGELDIEELKTRMKLYQKQNQVDLIKADIDDLLSEVGSGLERVRKIVQGLRDFSRVDQIAERTDYDVNEGVSTTLLVINNELKYDAEVICAFGVGVPQVIANGGQINQVILNLLLNAIQAIREHKNASDMGLIRIQTTVESGYVVIRVTDNGPGMSTETLNRLFEPFYTTKPPGLGTGLGLSICYDIMVNKHKGYLRANNGVDHGAVFEIGLPIDLPVKEE